MGRYDKFTNMTWCAAEPGTYPNAYVDITDSGEIKLSVFTGNVKEGWSVVFPRRFARMIARRIDQALEASQRK